MAVIKCKMCGGDLNIVEGCSTAECEFCGSVQTIPQLDDEKKLIQFERAERLRKQCEFDKAAGIYETIVADFRQEAEAYWGLVLCKYGIEYVDDPATGKKIPTCHRSSFDSIMEDSDFEQVLENADGMARRVYREEAKSIEEIRKGIIAVSANEEPYDIFICYKETDEKGERTLDSVLAQDVYDALTDKGYRVFFSRITLEDKLGVEYEPYIFAALNSAKIMLAFGTDYEYFNAVWVKNEWSRYLKLMAKDKEKHLIPCFKGIDAYDMPKEFAKLQAQDLGKVGAMQDLMRGIDKILPRQTAQTVVVQERVVVGGGGDNKIASLLDRGNMALEDGDWAKADSFFEDVLNNDSKNAQAYLGKTLAQEKCRTIDAFVRKRKDASQIVRGETLKLQPDNTRIEKAAEQFSLPGYVEPDEIRKLYVFDLSYHSNVAERQQQYRSEEKYWADHKLLSRAAKFATGAVAQNLQTEKKALFAALSERVQKAEETQNSAKKALLARYEAHLLEADKQAEQLYHNGISRREQHYLELLQIAKNASNIEQLNKTAALFATMGDYQDSKNLAEHCRNRAAEEQAIVAAEAERQQLLKEQQEKKRRAKRTRTAILLGICAAALLFIILLNTVILPNIKYNKAVSQLEAGNFETAIQMFEALGDFKDSEFQITMCQRGILDRTYNEALKLMEERQFSAAYDLFATIPDFRDAEDQMLEARYQQGLSFWNQKDYEISNVFFTELGNYKDSAALIHNHLYSTETEKEPTCLDEGTKVLTCYCGHTTKESIPATGHTYDAGTEEQAATCAATGIMRYTCHCGVSTTEVIEKKAHDYSGKTTTSATCEKSGVKTYTCKVCKDAYTETIAALGHRYSTATCTAAATCSTCKHVKQQALGHTTDYGMCSRCNKTFAPSLVYTGSGSGTHTFTLPKGKYKITLTVSNPRWDFKFGMFGPGLLFLTQVDGPGTYTETVELYENYENKTISISEAGNYTIKVEPI